MVFVRHSLGMCVGFQAFKLQQGQSGEAMSCLGYSILHMIPYTIPCCSKLFHVMHHMLFHVILLFHAIPNYSMLFHTVPGYSI